MWAAPRAGADEVVGDGQNFKNGRISQLFKTKWKLHIVFVDSKHI